MIVPSPHDVAAIAKKGEGLVRMRAIASEVCRSRGERPPTLMLGKPKFDAKAWKIATGKDMLEFFHEIGHLVSLLDRGSFGTEEEAEAFAHGCILFRAETPIIPGSWRAASNPMRTIIWTARYMFEMRDMVDSWTKHCSSSSRMGSGASSSLRSSTGSA